MRHYKEESIEPGGGRHWERGKGPVEPAWSGKVLGWCHLRGHWTDEKETARSSVGRISLPKNEDRNSLKWLQQGRRVLSVFLSH